VPDANYSVELTYLYKPTSLVTDTTGTWLSTNAKNALLYGALVEAYTFLKGEQDLMALYENRFMQEIERLKNRAEARGRRDERCNKNLIEYPIAEVIKDLNCHYLNNTVAYAIAFALWNQVSCLKLFGIDFSYKGNLHFAEAGRACVEFWLCKCSEAGMQIEVASSSGLLDTSIPLNEKLYGYHRLKDPLLPVLKDGALTVQKQSSLEKKATEEQVLIGRHDEHLKPVEPNKW
jgi:hypothetical protein